MFSANNKISLRQFQILLIFDTLNIFTVLLPSRLSRISGNDSIFLIIFGYIFSVISLFFITNISSLFPFSSFSNYTAHLLGKSLSCILTIVFSVKIIITAALSLNLFSQIINSTILFSTPPAVISLLLLLFSSYSAAKGYEVRARMAEILIFFFLIPLSFVYILTLSDTDFSAISPLLLTDKRTLFSGSVFALFSFSSLEFIFLAYPYVVSSQYIRRSAFSALSFSALALFFIVFLTVSRFGAAETASLDIPVIEIMDTIDFSTIFIERQNALVMTVWIISSFMIINGGIFFSALLIKDLTCLFSPKGIINSIASPNIPFIIISAVLIFLISFIPHDIPEIIGIFDKINYTLSLFYLYILPVILIIAARVRKGGIPL